ncbi:MAG: prepilin-type N-terminal cleavage/methylation domain-containing protein [Clostridia bacterium]
MKKTNKKKGFTLVELLIVIVIIGILAGVLIPTMSGVIKRAHISTVTSAIGNLNTTLATLRVEGLTLEDISEYGEVSAPKLRNALIKEEAVNAEQLDKFNVAYNNGYSVFFDSATFTFVLKSQEDIIANNSYVKATNNPFGLQTTYAETVSQDQDYAFPQNSIIKGMTFMNYLSKADRSNKTDPLLYSLSIFQDFMDGVTEFSAESYLASLMALTKENATVIGSAENTLLTHTLSRSFINIDANGLKRADMPRAALLSLLNISNVPVNKLPVLPTLQAMLDNAGVAKAYVLPSNIFEGYDTEASLVLTIPENMVINVEELAKVITATNSTTIKLNVTTETKTTTQTGGIGATGTVSTTTNDILVQVATDTSKVVTITNNITNGVISCMGKDYASGSKLTIPVGSKNISIIVKGANGFRPELLPKIDGLTPIANVIHQYAVDTMKEANITISSNFTVKVIDTYALTLNANLGKQYVTNIEKPIRVDSGDVIFKFTMSSIFNMEWLNANVKIAGNSVASTVSQAGNILTVTIKKADIDTIANTLTLDRNRTLNFVIEVYVDVNVANLDAITTAINNGSQPSLNLLFKLTENLTNVTASIGNIEHPFAGIFDGNGKTIANVTLTSTSNHIGLFSYLAQSGEIKNLNVSSAIINNTTKGSSIGVIAGYSLGKVTNCNVTGTIKITADVSVDSGVSIGSIVGSQITTPENSNNTITNCSCTATITINGAVVATTPLIGKETKKS